MWETLVPWHSWRCETGNSQVQQIDFLFNLHVAGHAVYSPLVPVLDENSNFWLTKMKRIY